MTVENHPFSDFMQVFTLSCLVTKPTCHQSKIATCIGLILTKNKNHCELSVNLKISLSNHHMLISTIVKPRNLKKQRKTLQVI